MVGSQVDPRLLTDFDGEREGFRVRFPFSPFDAVECELRQGGDDQ